MTHPIGPASAKPKALHYLNSRKPKEIWLSSRIHHFFST